MRCPKCTSIEDKVIDSRISKEGSTIRRRRECLECGHRFTTSEELVRDSMVIVKRDGRREALGEVRGIIENLVVGRQAHRHCTATDTPGNGVSGARLWRDQGGAVHGKEG